MSLLAAMLGGGVAGQEAAGFVGVWATKLDNHVFVVATLEAVPGNAGRFTGSLSRPQHFTTSGVAFSGIRGPAVQEAIVRSSVSGNCVLFATQDARDKSETDFQLCQTGGGARNVEDQRPRDRGVADQQRKRAGSGVDRVGRGAKLYAG